MSVSIEYIILLSITILLLSFIIYYNSSYSIFVWENRNQAEIYYLVNFIAEEINLAVKGGSGYSRIFFLKKPPFNFTLEINNYLVKIYYKGNIFQNRILVENVTGNFRFNSHNLIRNIENKIYVN